MKTLLSYSFPVGIKRLTNLRKKWPKYMSQRHQYAKSKLVRYSYFRLFLQEYSCFAFKFEHHSYSTSRAFNLKISITQPCLAFIYALKGNIHVAQANGQPSTTVQERLCFALVLPAGNYACPIDIGKRKAIILVLNTKWMLDNLNLYAEFADILKDIINDTPTYQLLPCFKMNAKMDKHIKRLREIKFSPTATIEKIALPLANSLAQDYYELYSAKKANTPSLIYKSSRQLAHEVRDRIIALVENGNIPVITTIASEFAKSPSTLRRLCIKTFRMNMHDLILDAQMKLAHILVKQGLLVKDISIKLGYADYTVFSRKYKNYFGYSPEHDRKKLKEKDMGR